MQSFDVVGVAGKSHGRCDDSAGRVVTRGATAHKIDSLDDDGLAIGCIGGLLREGLCFLGLNDRKKPAAHERRLNISTAIITLTANRLLYHIPSSKGPTYFS